MQLSASSRHPGPHNMSSLMRYLHEECRQSYRHCTGTSFEVLGEALETFPWLDMVTKDFCLQLANKLYCDIQEFGLQNSVDDSPKNSKVLLFALSYIEKRFAVIVKNLEHQFFEICETLEDRLKQLVARIREFILTAEMPVLDYSFYKSYEYCGRTAIAAMKWLHDRSNTATIWYKDLDELEEILYDINVSMAVKKIMKRNALQEASKGSHGDKEE